LLRELDERQDLHNNFCSRLAVRSGPPKGGDYRGNFVALSFEIVTLRLHG
jgi:hypothetical protein